ncbi:MAG: N-acetyltransferase [Akkermansiaceae bacterium]|jgi:putative acetyltransferase|nr:N-acetyltransferase [Akkermansiaceae bacterium]
MKIRIATGNDSDAVRSVHRSAFPQAERDIVSQLAVDLLAEETDPPVLSLIAEVDALVDAVVVGHLALSPVRMRDTGEFIGYILAPLAVSPDHQKRGIGSQLIKSGFERLAAMGSGILLVYGDPDFYGRFGFNVDLAAQYLPPYPLQYPFGWLGQGFGEFKAPSSAVPISCVSPLRMPCLW